MQKCCAVLCVLLLLLSLLTPSLTAPGSRVASVNDLDGVESSGFTPSYEDEEEDDGSSGFSSGDGIIIDEDGLEPVDNELDDLDNMINETDPWGSKELEEVQLGNEVGILKKSSPNLQSNSVSMASSHGNLLDSTEVVAALIAGGAIGLLFAVLLILLLVYRMRKKDAGSYDLSKKPIYTKAPTNEFYA
ncbi:syndecan-4 [Callorhinchus milii]|uniref:Syndecan-4 n=1 Tax=Callorhinchus milii TaxID=7868 RepID=V9L3C0_CALMI|nr:syndecan-4 [Callorhinchus milii]|eukprot:gi/632987999/ref/XP_007882866.1/ PREDICTED: syndecan-4 [Callorhinchus milii]